MVETVASEKNTTTIGQLAGAVTALALLLLLFYQLSASTLLPRFIDFTALRWNFGPSCIAGAAPAGLQAMERSAGTNAPQAQLKEGKCSTAPFELMGNAIEISYVNVAKHHSLLPLLEIRDAEGKPVYSAPLPRSQFRRDAPAWRNFIIPLGAEHLGKQLTLHVTSFDRPGKRAWFAVRDRLGFYRTQPLLDRLSGIARGGIFRIAVCLLLATALFLLGRRITGADYPLGRFAILLFISIFAIHFRLENFFCWDEWNVIERFRQLGLPGVVYTHNEHFLPLFFGFYFGEAQLFGTAYPVYLLISAMLHTLNAVLLAALLERLAGNHPAARPVARTLACLFALSALQGEVLEWAFEQSILLCQAFLTLSLILGLDAVQHGHFRKLLLSAILAAVCPFFFGNGFIAIVQLALTVALVTPAALAAQPDRSAYAVFEERLRRGFVLIVAGIVFSVLPLALYFAHRSGAGHGVADAPPVTQPGLLFAYVFVGTQLGAVLRGLGLYPSLATDAAAKYAPVFAEYIPRGFEPNLFLAYLGFGVSLFLLFIALCSRDLVKNLCLWLLGQLLMTVALVLPAFGRWQFGPEQSLSLRYHTQTLVGLAVICLPALLVLSDTLNKRSTMFRLPQRALSTVLGMLIIAHLTAQLLLGLDFTYFSERGAKTRMFVAELVHWQEKLDRMSPYSPLPYSGAGTDVANLEPTQRHTVAPGMPPESVYRAYRWLKR